MYHHIVVAVDGSNTSLNALKHAAVLANAGNAKLTLLTVANPGEYMTLAPEFLQHDSYEEAAVSSGNTHGRSGLMHLLMGSFAETVMRQSHLPLLVIRSQSSEETAE